MDAYSWLRRGVFKLKKTFLPISGDGAATSATNNNNKSSRSNLPEYEEKLYGITDLLIEFVKSFSIETFSNFRIVEEEGSICNSGHLGNVRTDLSEWQEIHAKLALSRIKELAELRFRLCPRYLKEWQFWRIYFALVRSYVAEYELEAVRLAKIERIKMGTDGYSSKNSACEVEMLEAKFTPSVELKLEVSLREEANCNIFNYSPRSFALMHLWTQTSVSHLVVHELGYPGFPVKSQKLNPKSEILYPWSRTEWERRQ